ncbi:alpha-1,4-glucan--maltose-1-phosphate maltosyltransferase [Kibdelosporangium persicum]|uniref:Alpha-1,4-glucan:maltose-1-phosphate maltosyltransferase n=1 Tax=Kibdelosporangium persicum TaxID=2698649 RepID=A0ABX2FFF0_9PSEU|nr:alpha-1,4-glucan--maltose-1-phosphate maltosyltransferase [Kibdelosporangium persicum]NRN69605.1 Starch synthase (Maltosyl-transferring) [Kibdelosporangium persicum]
MTGRLGIDHVTPHVECGRYPVKAVVGECLPIHATVWREGHDAVAASVVWQGPGGTAPRTVRMSPHPEEPDRWLATVVPDETGMWSFHIEAWSDPWSTWRHAAEVKAAAGQNAEEMANDLEIGARLLCTVAERPRYATDRGGESRQLLTLAAAALRDTERPLADRLTLALSPPVERIMTEDPVRELITEGERHEVYVDRQRALFGSWYELFPRSTGGWDAERRPVHGTFKTAAEDLPRVAAMGFDVVYLTPIHPIGEVNRKGRNNTLHREPDDVGSPWAIGSADGGHDAIHPRLGTMADFDDYVAAAADLGLEVALDLALQAAPDHPWVKRHPEWFTTLPDGSIAYAENPPKKYQDIYPLNFDNDPEGIYAEVLRVVRHWAEHGVRIFRVDNPHTKPPNFWEWLIWKVKEQYPDVLFLSEAFTRPARLYGLARLGFTQSYTYFTWRTGKQELIEFGQELVAHADEARPNLFVNTQDILHASLQQGGPGMFAIRAVLAATFSPTWGVYSGYELFEDTPLRQGSEEYLDSEKYQLRPRDYAAARAEGRSLEPFLTRLNQIRRAHSALQQLRTLRFHHVDNDAMLAYSKVDPATSDTVIVVVTLNPFGTEEATVWLDLPAIGMQWNDQFTVADEITGERYTWGQANFVRLQPWRAVSHILTVVR